MARVSRAGIVERIAFLGGYAPITDCREGDDLRALLANADEALSAIGRVLADDKARTMVIHVMGKNGTGRRLARIYPGTRPHRVFVVIHKLF